MKKELTLEQAKLLYLTIEALMEKFRRDNNPEIVVTYEPDRTPLTTRREEGR